MTSPPGQPQPHPDAERGVDTILGGKYRIDRVIGEGAFGRVYLAFDPLLRRNVAVKELLANRTLADPATYEKYLERFQREARAASRLDHPNIVGVYELAVDKDGNYYLVMQYVDGTDLRALLDQVGTLPVERAVSICLDVAHGLEVIHEQDIVHRDLKPANVMITSRGTARITDFGIAQVGHESLRTQMVVGHPGTPLYMSPEQTSGIAYVDGRSDLFSLGLILYEMLAGEPFARRRRPLEQVHPGLPPHLYGIVNRLTAPEPGNRYQGGSDLIVDLRQLQTAPSMRTHQPDPYQMPGIGPTPAGQQVWNPGAAQGSSFGSLGGASQTYEGATFHVPPPASPSYWQSAGPSAVRPVPPAPISQEQQRILAKENVRIQAGRNGLPQYVISNGAIARKLLRLFVIALIVWVSLPVIASGVQDTRPLYGILLGVWALIMFGAPVALLVRFFRLRGRAKAFIKGIEQRR